MHFTQHRLYHPIRFIGQLLVWTSCSFFVATWLLPEHTPLSRHDHHDDATIPGGVPGTRDATDANKSLVDTDLAILLEEMQSSSEHSAPSLSIETAKQKYAELCSIYVKNCTSTFWQGSYDRTEKYLYQGLSIALLQQIDKRLKKGSVQSKLTHLSIYKDDTDRRGSAGHTTVRINSKKIPSSREYREVLTHELSHVIDLGVLIGKKSTKNQNFTEFGKVMRSTDDPSLSFYELSRLTETTRTREASFKDFVSGYAMKNIYEDFAESQNLRFNHNLLFQELARNNGIIAKKYDYFKNLYTNKWFDNNTRTLLTAKTDIRPWDTTRIQ